MVPYNAAALCINIPYTSETDAIELWSENNAEDPQGRTNKDFFI